MKFKEISSKSATELQKDLVELREKSNELMVKSRLGQIKNNHQIQVVRRDIARVLTALKLKS